MLHPLVWLQRLQGLLDLLLQIQPQTQGMNEAVLILEAMDCVIIDVYGIYSKICNGIANVLLNICSAGRTEASMALQILHKSREQGEELSMFIERCKEMKVANALQCPSVEQVPERDFREVERMVSGVSEADRDCSVFEMGNAVVAVREDRVADREGDLKRMKTVITNEWEVFEEDLIKFSGEIGSGDMGRRRRRRRRRNGGEEEDPFAASVVPIPYQAYVKNQEVPDLISFL
ncbi:hypothetical protein RHMOL_Rhmol09G0115800 [Rhododendron molle]|uniref:Uncharacterized protein n=1 Tax=Rhododendron molle TaxID=49168 RepID=A0ACC0ME57_RHOML|nr:hypothetical protein RHMOL_Rhmol09G0115800 [Rhododendron molle]